MHEFLPLRPTVAGLTFVMQNNDQRKLLIINKFNLINVFCALFHYKALSTSLRLTHRYTSLSESTILDFGTFTIYIFHSSLFI